MSDKDYIITLPNPHLREKSRRVAVITDEVREAIQKMKDATLDCCAR
jgi:peptide deformylase